MSPGVREARGFLLLMGFVRVFSDSTEKTLKSTELVAHPLHVLLLNTPEVY